MAEAYFPVGPGLGSEENFLSLDDILMSQEKLPGRAESSLPRLAFALEQSTQSTLPTQQGQWPRGSRAALSSLSLSAPAGSMPRVVGDVPIQCEWLLQRAHLCHGC
uniref:Uncharacterized protein n=1 Tax=Anser brachyrhynchus TaxID=132585 RepID=A0A8B9I4E6_9AVES